MDCSIKLKPIRNIFGFKATSLCHSDDQDDEFEQDYGQNFGRKGLKHPDNSRLRYSLLMVKNKNKKLGERQDYLEAGDSLASSTSILLASTSWYT